ncbi:hypothetical protein N7470_005847 [Penicillium chermesinum]|nr:hypothetical protein N7470_005847 [Penicillium chermesinum]
MTGMAKAGPLKEFAIRVIFLGALVSMTSATQCYYPDGSPSNDVPCQSGTDTTWCCSPKSACLDNGLCLNLVQPYQLSRVAVPLRVDMVHLKITFLVRTIAVSFYRYYKIRIDSGLILLLAETDSERSGGAAIIPFSNNDTHSTYCCNSVVSDHDVPVCSKPNNTVLSPPSPWQLWKTGAIIPGFAALSTLSSNGDTSPFVQNSTSGSSTSSPTGSASSGQHSDSKDAAIGAGVGVPLGVLLILALAWGFIERRKRKRFSSQAITPQTVPSFQDTSQSQKGSYGGYYSNDIGMRELSSSTPTTGLAELYEQQHDTPRQ